MTAAELASFRTLLQAQALPPPRPDRGLFARMRARLTLVERAEPSGDAPRRTLPPPPPPRLAASSWDETDVRVADPPPSTPPVFGRRETGPEAAAEPARAPAQAPELETVRLRPRPGSHVEEEHATPDELPAQRRPSVSAAATPPGTIAGWSRARPPSAQRRILRRLEAVFVAELQGLDARIAADAPVR